MHLDGAGVGFDNRRVVIQRISPRPSWGWIPFLLLLVLFVPRPAPADDEAISVRLLPLDGKATSGRLTALDAGGVTLETSTGLRTTPLGEVRRLDVATPAVSPPTPTAHMRVALTGGEVLIGGYAGGAPDGFVLDTPDLGRLVLPLDVVQTLVPVPPDAGPCYEPQDRRSSGNDDVAFVRSGDGFAGIVLAVDDEGIEVETESGRTRRVAWDDLVVLHLENDPAPTAQGIVVEIETVAGARLVTNGDVTLEEGRLVFAPRSLPERRLSIPLHRVRTLRTRGGAFVYASDLPFESEFVPYYRDETGDASFLDRWFHARVDRRPTGCPLRLDGVTYRHGFAVHSRSFVRIPLGKHYRLFEVLFGVDDEALEKKAGGIVNARVRGDGKVLWEAKDVRAGTAPRRVGPLDVSQVDELVLEVDFGAELHIRDRATWADPLLIRSE